jgi:N-acetylglucosaminyldiphosphoundecaprenol N-acetyl-beta-D-mannosaminyltransferase
MAPPSTPPFRQRKAVLGAQIDALTAAQAVARVHEWAQASQSRYVCICNAHSAVTAQSDHQFKAAIAGADMATPDGAPVAWLMRRQGVPGQKRVSGPDLMLDYLALAAQRGEPIGLLGSTPQTLHTLQQRLLAQWPSLRIAYAVSPPFRPLTTDEDNALVKDINASGARTLWVSLGCPKQELWMAAHAGRVQAVMVGVGAAFDFHAGTVKRAPLWMREHGLEWLHRLVSEPRRLWKRYLVTNTLFILGALRQMLAPR